MVEEAFRLRLADSPRGMAENDRAIAPLMDSVGQSWTHPQSHDPHDTTWGRDKSSLDWLLKHFSPTQGQKRLRVEQVVKKIGSAQSAMDFFFYRFVFLLLEFVGPCLPSGLGDSTTRPTASFWVFFFILSSTRPRIIAIGSMCPTALLLRSIPLLPPDHSQD
jgi:hypothetical protein